MAKRIVTKKGGLAIETAYTRFTSRIGLTRTSIEIANDSLNHYVAGFTQGAGKGGGKTDKSEPQWERRKDDSDGASTRAILVKSGDLWNDIDLLKVTNSEIEIGTKNIKYAVYHNEGIAGKLDQREFLGDSKELNKKNRESIVDLLNRVLKS